MAVTTDERAFYHEIARSQPTLITSPAIVNPIYFTPGKDQPLPIAG